METHGVLVDFCLLEAHGGLTLMLAFPERASHVINLSESNISNKACALYAIDRDYGSDQHNWRGIAIVKYMIFFWEKYRVNHFEIKYLILNVESPNKK